jgi:hypothetical protein
MAEMYEVTWRISIEAEGPDAAARIAREIQMDVDSLATVFEVRDESGNGYTVDLGDEIVTSLAPAEEGERNDGQA